MKAIHGSAAHEEQIQETSQKRQIQQLSHADGILRKVVGANSPARTGVTTSETLRTDTGSTGRSRKGKINHQVKRETDKPEYKTPSRSYIFTMLGVGLISGQQVEHSNQLVDYLEIL